MYRRTSLPSPEYSPRSVCSWTAAIGALAELGGGSALVGGATAASLGYSAYSSAKSSSQISASMKQANAAQQALAQQAADTAQIAAKNPKPVVAAPGEGKPQANVKKKPQNKYSITEHHTHTTNLH